MPLPDADVYTVMRTASSTNDSDVRNDLGISMGIKREVMWLHNLFFIEMRDEGKD